MPEVVAVFAALLAWAAAALKVAGVRRQPRRMAPRALLLTLVALAAGWTCLVPSVADALDEATGSATTSQALADTLALSAGCGTQAMLLFLTQDEATGRRLMRPRLVALAAAVVVMVTAAGLHTPAPGPDAFADHYVPTWYFVAYSVPYLAFLTYIFTGITRLCWHYARQSAALPTLQAGLRLIAAGGSVGFAYVAVRAAYLVAARFDPSRTLAHLHDLVSAVLIAALTLLVTVGAVLPSAAPRVRAYRDLRQLYPLWRAMLHAFPEVGGAQGEAAASPLIDVLPSRRLRFRRTRRVVEIRDGEFALRRRLRSGVRERVRARALQAGLRGEELDATVEAGQLAVALRERGEVDEVAHQTTTTTTTVPGGASLDAEAAWLRRVAYAFHRSPVVSEAVAAEDTCQGRAGVGGQCANRAAKVITEVAGPAPLLAVILLAAGAGTGRTVRSGLGWGLVAAVFFSVLPIAAIVAAVRRGRLSDHHVSQRAQRPRVIALSLVSFAAGSAVLFWGGAPRALLAVLGALLAAALACLLLTLRWKVSIHLGVAGCAASLMTLLFGPPVLMIWPAMAAVAWSRIRLRAHTPAQAVVGALVGAAVSAAVFTATR